MAVELVHAATLVHDDVLDGSSLRRGRPTVVAAAGAWLATATGDLLFSRAFAELAAGGSVEPVRVLSRASSELAVGELMQRADAWDRVSVERYLERCRLKTAVLFRAACELGALEGDRRRVDTLGSFGERIGVAFQLLDDVLDVTGTPGANRQAAGRRPARRDRDAAADHRSRARPGAGVARVCGGQIGRRRASRCASDRGHRGAGGR